MPNAFKRRDLWSVLLSALLHTGLGIGLVTIPQHLRPDYGVVDLSIQQKPKRPEPEPEVEPEEEIPEEPEKPKPLEKKAIKEPAKEEPPEEPPEPEKEEAPPVFDLGDNTFAEGNGQGGGWQLQRSDGNTKLAAVAGNKPSVRGTKVKTAPAGKPGGKGMDEGSDAPVPLKDLSQRPQPKDGPPPAPPYPLEARKAGIEGPVVLQVFIDKTGRVRRTRVIKSPSELLAEAAKSAMAQVLWTTPLDKTGKPVDTVIVWTYRYVLDG